MTTCAYSLFRWQGAWEDKNKIPQNQPKPKDKNYSEKVNEGFGESKSQQEQLKKAFEIPPKPPKKDSK